MNFDELVDQVGLGIAVMIMKDKLTREFWESLSYDELMEIHLFAPEAKKDEIWEMALKAAETFEEYANLVCFANDPDRENRAMARAIERAQSPCEWIQIYCLASTPETETLAIGKLREIFDADSIAI